METNENGARLLLDQIDTLLKGKKLTEKERLLWLVHRYSLAEITASRARQRQRLAVNGEAQKSVKLKYDGANKLSVK